MFNFPTVFADPENNNLPKKRPPEATPVTLPAYQVKPLDSTKLASITSKELRDLFVCTYPSKWQYVHHQALGIEFKVDMPIEAMVSQSYIPPEAKREQPIEEEENQILQSSCMLPESLSNGREIPKYEDFWVRAKELKYDREEAIKALSRRKPISEGQGVKLVHYRKFWMSLDIVSHYWDTSKDDYYPADSENRRFDIGTTSLHREKGCGRLDLPKEVLSNTADTFRASKPMETSLFKPENVQTQVNPSAREVKDYFGIRRSTGREMANSHRNEMIANFIEPVVQAMGCHFNYNRSGDDSILNPKNFVQIVDGRIRIPVSGFVSRIPSDQGLARQGWSEGPLIAVSVRANRSFSQFVNLYSHSDTESTCNPSGNLSRNTENLDHGANHSIHQLGDRLTAESPDPVEWNDMDVIDASLEFGTLLMLAQFRHRRARSEDEPVAGSGAWWANKPRFGNHPSKGEEIGEPMVGDTENLDFVLKDSLTSSQYIHAPSKARSLFAHNKAATGAPNLANSSEFNNGSGHMSSVMRRKTASYKQNKNRNNSDSRKRRREFGWLPPRPIWDSKTYYFPVGMGPEQEFDCVYLISSVFHHVSVLSLRIHPKMLDFLSSKLENSSFRVEDLMTGEQYGLFVQRTRWFDLLKPADRVEALRVIWAANMYMMRETGAMKPGDQDFARSLANSGTLATS